MRRRPKQRNHSHAHGGASLTLCRAICYTANMPSIAGTRTQTTPPHSHSGGLFPAWKRGNFIWREKTPLLGSGGFLPPNHPLSPAPLGAAAPRPCVRRFATRTASLPSFPAENSRLFQQKLFQCLKNLVSGLQKYFRYFPDAFSAFGSAPVAFPAHFCPSGAFPLLSRRIFSLWECSQGFPRTFPGFGSIPTASPACFQPLGVLPRLPPRIFVLREHSQGFPRAFPTFGSIPVAFPAHFRPLGAFPLLSRRIFSLWERSCGKLAGFRECARNSHRHCPRVARKSYKIFSSGG